MVKPGRPHGKSPTSLGVWANGERMGTWSVDGGTHRFQYDGEWPRSAHARPLSLSLPFLPDNVPYRGELVRNFFDNLLPDSQKIRERLRDKFSTGSTQAFDLLAAIGRDCVGAVQLLPPEVEPDGFDTVTATALDPRGVEQALNNALSGGRVLGQQLDDDFRISIAGAQEKTALLWHEGRWQLPHKATPTTHIFKLPLGLIGNLRFDMSNSVENEWLCGQILAGFGLPVARSEIATFGIHKVLIVERFDRAWQRPQGQAPWIARMPQEDFCQALGVAADNKYESKGGPGIPSILRQLEMGSRPDADKRTFIKAQLLFWIMAAIDGHAKNFSIFLERGGAFRMTPLYDVLSAWPIMGTGPNQLHYNRAKLAMALRGKHLHYNLREIKPRHWELLAQRSGVAGAFDELVAVVLQVPQVLEEIAAGLPRTFPRALFDAVRAGMLRMAGEFVDDL